MIPYVTAIGDSRKDLIHSRSFALDFGLVCIGFMYDCRCKLLDSSSTEEGAIYATILSYIREGTIAIMFQVENLEFFRIIQ